MKPLSIPYNITFNPENGIHTLHVPSPLPGDWFMLAYVKKIERNYYGYPQDVSRPYVLSIELAMKEILAEIVSSLAKEVCPPNLGRCVL